MESSVTVGVLLYKAGCSCKVEHFSYIYIYTYIQEQALSTRSIEARVYHTRQDSRCRLHEDAPETIRHITADCEMQVGRAYMESQVTDIVYRNMYAEHGLEAPRLRWDREIRADKLVMAN